MASVFGCKLLGFSLWVAGRDAQNCVADKHKATFR